MGFGGVWGASEGNSRYLSTEEFNTLLSSEVVTYCEIQKFTRRIEKGKHFCLSEHLHEGVPKVMIEAEFGAAFQLHHSICKEIIKN